MEWLNQKNIKLSNEESLNGKVYLIYDNINEHSEEIKSVLCDLKSDE